MRDHDGFNIFCSFTEMRSHERERKKTIDGGETPTENENSLPPFIRLFFSSNLRKTTRTKFISDGVTRAMCNNAHRTQHQRCGPILCFCVSPKLEGRTPKSTIISHGSPLSLLSCSFPQPEPLLPGICWLELCSTVARSLPDIAMKRVPL